MSAASRLVLVALAMALLLAPLATLHPAVTHLYEAGLANLRVETSHPQVIVFLVLTLVSALPAAGFLISLITAARSQDGLRALLTASEPAILKHIHYRVVQSDAVLLFTAGLFRPVIFVSSQATSRLSTAELHAALLHERAHQLNRDVLWGLLLRAVSWGFRFLPQTSRLVQRVALRAECDADEFALRRGARRIDLFEAIAAASPSSAHVASVGIANADVQLRLVRLVHPETPIPGQPTGGFFALGTAIAVPAILAHVITVVAAFCTTNVV